MKKILFFAALVLGLASCSTDPEDLNVVVGGEQDVMLNVSLPEATRSASNAGFDFTNFESNNDYDLRYILEIRYNGKVSRTVKTAESTSVSFPVRLAPGREYDFTVWADLVLEGSEDDLCYNTNVDGAGLTNITIKNEKWTANNELRDAYYGKATLTEEQSITNLGTIELTRPFAKIRVISTDIEDVRKFDIEPYSVSVQYLKEVYTSFNAVTGVAGTPVANKTVSAEYANAKYDDFDTAEATLFADYIFVPNDGTIQFSMDVKTESKSIKVTSFTTPIAVGKNKLTTIKGDVLTEGGDVNVDIEDEFGGESGIEDGKTFAKVDTVEELKDAINNGIEKIILEGDNTIMFDESVSIPAGVTTTIDLNGKSLKGADASVNVFDNEGELTIIGSGEITTRNIRNRPGAKLVVDGDFTIIGGAPTAGSAIWNEGDAVINNVTIQQVNTTNYAIKNVTIGSTLVVNNANVISKHGAIANDAAGTLTVNGGYYEVTGSSSDHVIYAPYGGVTINNGTFNLSQVNASVGGSTIIDGAVVINGGTFDSAEGAFAFNGEAGLVVKGGTFKNKATTVYGGDFAHFVPAGYKAVDYGDGTYTVVNLRASEVEIYGLTLKPNGDNSKVIVNDKEGFMNLTQLFNDWTDLFTDGNGTTYTNYANGAGVDYYYAGRWTVSLEADIDLNNANISPIIIKHPVATGSPAFEGNDHTIKNAVIVTDTATENEAGLFVSSPCGFNNLKLDNIHVTGSNVGNSTAGVLTGSNRVGIDNITITNSSVEGGKYTGGVLGYGYTDVTNCSLTNVSVKGGYKLGGLIGYICASNGNTHDVTGNTLTNCSVNGIGGGIYAGGKSEYIIGMLVGNYNCNGTCKDNVVYGITTTATKAIGKIEAGKVVTESNNNVTYVVENNGELNTALTNGGKIELANGNYTMPEPDLRGKTLTITGTRDVVIDATAVAANDQFVTGATMVFDGVTINFGTTNYMGFANTASLTYKNCKINGLQFLYGENITFENCEFDSNGAEHSVWTYGGKNVTFTECDFTYGDRCVNCYKDQDIDGGKQVVNFTKCTFTTTNTASEGAVEINSSAFSIGIEVNLTGCTAPAYGELAYVSPWDGTNGAKTTINIQ